MTMTPNKGTRIALTTRLPPEHASAVETAARELGMGVSDFLSLCVADQLRLERPPYLGGPRSQYRRSGKYKSSATKQRARAEREDMARAG